MAWLVPQPGQWTLGCDSAPRPAATSAFHRSTIRTASSRAAHSVACPGAGRREHAPRRLALLSGLDLSTGRSGIDQALVLVPSAIKAVEDRPLGHNLLSVDHQVGGGSASVVHRVINLRDIWSPMKTINLTSVVGTPIQRGDRGMRGIIRKPPKIGAVNLPRPAIFAAATIFTASRSVPDLSKSLKNRSSFILCSRSSPDPTFGSLPLSQERKSLLVAAATA